MSQDNNWGFSLKKPYYCVTYINEIFLHEHSDLRDKCIKICIIYYYRHSDPQKSHNVKHSAGKGRQGHLMYKMQSLSTHQSRSFFFFFKFENKWSKLTFFFFNVLHFQKIMSGPRFHNILHKKTTTLKDLYFSVSNNPAILFTLVNVAYQLNESNPNHQWIWILMNVKLTGKADALWAGTLLLLLVKNNE